MPESLLDEIVRRAVSLILGICKEVIPERLSHVGLSNNDTGSQAEGDRSNGHRSGNSGWSIELEERLKLVMPVFWSDKSRY